ncbi:MAG TPA: tRNA pseudouridine(13) synthase TruD [Kofleriaceae bacterium]|jgi:tRNA pseudouridine13 synthase|nr:tRNA pseudouridine(13) synthase TruD [Kofleriaceae bacterium]
MAELPHLVAGLPGIGGRIREADDDFQVEEIPAYGPAGEGAHVLAWIEKRGLTTFDVVNRLAAALGVDPGDVGSAGLKDRHAVTRQQLSLPPPCTPEQALALDLPGVRVLSAGRHPHKLRTGHLRGNRFVIVVREVGPAADEAAARAGAILAALAAPPGSPNWYGEQRFGAAGDNAAVGRALITGGPLPAGARRPQGRQKRLMVSAFQSELFNDWLRRRIADGLYRAVLAGDVLQKRATGGVFVCADPDTDGARLAAGELVVTGPMFGHAMRRPAPGSPAETREDAVLADAGIELAAFGRAGKLAEGTRRAAAVDLGEPAARPAGPHAVELCFDLPAGAYATAVLREIIEVNKTPC